MKMREAAGYVKEIYNYRKGFHEKGEKDYSFLYFAQKNSIGYAKLPHPPGENFVLWTPKSPMVSFLIYK